ncbi:MAG: glycosyltransferase, partial [Candidatus Riflebacteria bacterium]|nr:glycosyltransferase [Candidatus Riflebacteria bacterium]
MSGEPRISLVQTNYQGRRNLENYLPRTLETVRNSPLVGEVLIADDASTDGSVQLLAERFPSVRVVALTRNRGFGATANAAFEAARFPYVLNISSDMVLEAGAVEAERGCAVKLAEAGRQAARKQAEADWRRAEAE